MTCTVCGMEFVREVTSRPLEGTFETTFKHTCPVLVALANDNRDLRETIVAAARRQKAKR